MQLHLAMRDCPIHKECTAFSMGSEDGGIGTVIHLTPAGIRELHTMLGKAVIALRDAPLKLVEGERGRHRWCVRGPVRSVGIEDLPSFAGLCDRAAG